MKIKLGHRQKEVEFRIEEVEGVDTPILEKIVRLLHDPLNKQNKP